MSHTKGPWTVVIDDTGGQYSGWPSIEASTELDISIVHRAGFHHEFWDAHSGLSETLANARLIASAPDLLEALETATIALDNALRSAGTSTAGYIATRKLMAKAKTEARAAIAQATETP